MFETEERPDNPMKLMRPPALPEKMVPVVEQDALQKLFKVLSGPRFEERRDKAIVSVFIDSGFAWARWPDCAPATSIAI